MIWSVLIAGTDAWELPISVRALAAMPVSCHPFAWRDMDGKWDATARRFYWWASCGADQGEVLMIGLRAILLAVPRICPGVTLEVTP